MQGRLRGPKAIRKFETYLEALFSSFQMDSLASDLERAEVPYPYQIRIKFFHSRFNIERTFARLVELDALEQFPSNRSAFRLTYRRHLESPKPALVRLFVAFLPHATDKGEVAMAVSIATAEGWHEVQRFFRKRYSLLPPIFLSQSELYQCATDIDAKRGYDAMIKAVSTREPIEGSRRRAQKAVREWTDEPVRKTIAEIKERHRSITSIEFALFARAGSETHALPSSLVKVRSSGEIGVVGNPRVAFENVVPFVSRLGQKNISFLSGRGLRDSDYRPRPLAINYDSPVFTSREAIHSFVAAMIKYPRAMKAVQHANPYAHIKVTDARDGSSFEVWAMPEAQIALVPGLTATAAAFGRLIHYVYEMVGEGALAEYGND